MVTNKKWRLVVATVLITGALTGCKPPGPHALLEGERLIKAGKYQEAIQPLREATLILPRHAQAWNHLGLAHHYARQFNPAVQAYRKALDLDYNLAAARFNLGSLLLEVNQPRLAVNEFAAFNVLQPESAAGWVRRGMAEWRDRQFSAAETSFRNSLRIDPTQSPVWNSLGIIKLYEKKNPEAYHAFNQALQHHADYAPALYNVALVSHYYLPRTPVDHRPFALDKYRDYLALTPRQPYADYVERIAAKLDSELNPKPAIIPPPPVIKPPTVAVKAPTVKPPVGEPPKVKPELTTAKTVIPARVVETPQSVQPTPPLLTTQPPLRIARIEPPLKSTEAPPNINPAPLPRSTAIVKPDPSRSTQDTKPVTKTTTSIFPSFDDIAPDYRGLRYTYLDPPAPSPGFRHRAMPVFDEAKRFQNAGRWDEAIATYRKAIQWDGGFFEAYHNLGLAASQGGEFLRAAVAFETALALRPNSDGTRYNFALLLTKKGYYRDAAIELEKILIQSPEDTRTHLLLANMYDQRLKQIERARDHYQRVMELSPGHQQGTAIRYWLRSH